MLFLTIMKKIQVSIDSMAFKGYGVARIDGKVTFVPYTMTGDEAWIGITQEKKSYSTATLVEIVKPSPRRANPTCPYFGSCGGCQWQHIDYSAQAGLKEEILRNLLKKLGGLKEIPSIKVFPSPKSYDYRVRIQLKVKGRAMGYYREGSHQIVDIDHCPISHPLVNRIFRNLREESAVLQLMKEIEINVSPEEGGGTILFHPHSDDRRIEPLVKKLLQGDKILRGIAIAGRGKINLLGDPIDFTIRSYQDRNLKLRIAPGSFSQVNLEQNQTLIQTVLQFSEVNKEDRVLDLYAGVGNLTLPLAMGAKEILGIEENRAAVKDGQFNAERNKIENCHFIQGRVEHVLSDWERERPYLIVLDPPRAGCKTIMDRVVRLEPEKIIYVSCEPTTFARDLRLFLERGYSLQRLSLIDMFPQTYHMEVVGLLKPNERVQGI
jgi:23S rRNA (uracil1939-C5)-methyltransferase